MSLQNWDVFGIGNPAPSSSRRNFGLGRFLFRRSRASRRRLLGRQADRQGVAATPDRSEQLEDRTLLASFNLVAGVADGTAGSLRDAIVTANSNGEADTIVLAAGTYTLDLTNAAGQESAAATGDIDILADGGNSLTITGAGAGSTVITQSVADRVFHVFGGANVTFENVTITGGQALDDGTDSVLPNLGDGDGGGLLIESGATVTIDSSTVTGNLAAGAEAGEGGGGIFNAGSLTITNSDITGNTANIAALGNGGGIFNDTGANLNVTGGSISGNAAGRAGGGIENNAGTVVLTNVTLGGATALEGNTAGINGGGLHVSGAGTTNVTGGTVQNNFAGEEGGGLWNGTSVMTINGASIDSNAAAGISADQGGGGVFNAGGTVLVINNTTITGNIASGTSGSGGGILNDTGGNLIVVGGTVSGNTANRAGGGIEDNSGSAGVVALTNVAIDNNSAGVDIGAGAAANPGNGGGLHISGGGNVTVAGGTVNGNVAAEEGGGLWNSTGTLTVTGTTINGNAALSGDNGGNDQGGGGIFNAGGTLDIENTTITANTADTNAGNGGGVMTVGGTVTIDRGAISGNTAARAGGGVENNGGSVTLTNVTLGGTAVADGNTADINGGGLHVSGAATTEIFGGSVSNNVAAQEGGGLWNSASGTMTISASGSGGTVIDSNIANGDDAATVQGGGGIFNVGGSLEISDATISNNVSTATLAGNGGGGIVIEGGANNTITDTTITGNTATEAGGSADGGGILVANGATLDVFGGQISANSASRAGGGIENNASEVNLFDVRLGGSASAEGNIAGVNGGGLHASGSSTTTISGGGVSNNVAGQEGGGLWNASGSMNIDGTMISANVANAEDNGSNDQGGGGLFNINGTVDIVGAVITDNSASVNAGNGGGVMTVGGSVLIDGGTISGNAAARAGGGIENNNGSVELINVTVGGATTAEGNTAGINGGGLHVTGGGTTDITAGSFENNSAGEEGGGLWNGTGSMTIDTTTIINNTASGDGSDQGGGGIFNAGGTIDISSGATISGNVANGAAGSGGGIFNDVDGELTIEDTEISTNTANRAGGGIEDNSGMFTTVFLTNVNLDNNSAGVDIGSGATASPGNGGGLHVTGDGTVVIDGGTVSGNVAAAEGGGLWNNTGDLNVIGVTISGNSAAGTGVDEGGGAIFNAGGNVDVQSSTLSGNTAVSGSGAAIFNEGGFVAIGQSSIEGEVAGGDQTDDSFDIDETDVTIVSQGGADVTVVSGDVGDETFTVTPDAGGLGATVTVQNGSTFTVNTDTEELNLFGDDGDDDFIIDFETENSLGTVTEVEVDGGAETSGDSLTLTGTGAFSSVTQVTTSAVDGSFDLNGALTVDYLSIESTTEDLNRGLSLSQTADLTIGAGAGTVEIEISAATDSDETPVLSVGALPSFATFIDNGDGTATVTFDASASDSGASADITVTATTSEASVTDTFSVTVVTPEVSSSQETVYAINAGGGATGDFSSDGFFNTGSSFSTGDSIDVSDSSIPEGTPSGIFKTTRFDRSGGSELQYAFPVDPGAYEVTLYFAEIYGPLFREGGRVFDVSIEGVLELDDFDVFAEAGAGNKGIARTFNVVSDGTLNIDFSRVVENPMVMGIEILTQADIPNAGPELDAIGSVSLESGQSTTINVSASDPEGDAISLAVSGLPSFASFVDNGNGTGTITVNSSADDEGVFAVSVQASAGSPVLTDSTSFALTVSATTPEPPPTPEPEEKEEINVNAGGPALSGDPGFQRDDSFQNGVGLDFSTGASIDTSDSSIPDGTPAQLFQSVTYDRAGGSELQFDIETEHTGITYEVTLYFAEIYGPTARTGARVFDVSIDGVKVLDDFDVFAEAGAQNRGIARTFQIVSDGNVDIDFGHETENPAVAGISVRQIDEVFSTP